MTQDKETLREAVARAIWPSDFDRLDAPTQQFHLRMADAAIATMFERLRTPTMEMLEAGHEARDNERLVSRIWQAMLTAFQQENSDA